MTIDTQKLREFSALEGFTQENIRDLLDHIDAQAAEIAALRQPWQPIETAPRTGSRVILAWGGQSITGFYLDNSQSQTPWAGWRTETLVPRPPGDPTHWMPFPAPPRAALSQEPT